MNSTMCSLWCLDNYNDTQLVNLYRCTLVGNIAIFILVKNDHTMFKV